MKRYADALEPARVCAHYGTLRHRVVDAGARQNASLKMSNLALVLFHLKKFDEMNSVLDEAEKLDPNNSRVQEIRTRKK